MELDKYIQFYKIDIRYKPIMQLLRPSIWYIFQTKGDLKTGFYSGSGPSAKRVDLTHEVMNACVKAKVNFSAFNVAPRGGVTGNRVKILFQ